MERFIRIERKEEGLLVCQIMIQGSVKKKERGYYRWSMRSQRFVEDL